MLNLRLYYFPLTLRYNYAYIIPNGDRMSSIAA